MLYPRQRRVTAFGALFFFIFFAVFFAAWHTSRYPSLPDAWVDGLSFSPSSALSSSSSSRSSSSSSSPSSTASVSHDAALSNSTLGFSNIFVVGLPERSDKRDAISLAASLTGINVEWVEGIKGESIPDKAVPFGVSRKELMETNLGSWRGHMNALRRIVEEGIESALIMEDDVDWDVHLKAQLPAIAAGTRSLIADLPSIFSPVTGGPLSAWRAHTSPYGDNWDVLWLGHCGDQFPEHLGQNEALAESDPGREAMSRKITILNDTTVPPLGSVKGLVDFTSYQPHTRFVHVSGAPICTFAYAVSQRGARKVLYGLSVNGLAGPFDNSLAWLCERGVSSWPAMAANAAAATAAGDDDGDIADEGDRGLDTKCFSVTPPLFVHHRAKGRVAGDSDIQNYDGGPDGGHEVREKGLTENIVWSTRLNLKNLILGTPLENQYEAAVKSAQSGGDAVKA